MTQDTERSKAFLDENETLVERFQAGDRSAFDRLVTTHQDRVYNLCYRFLGDHQEANDCAQEAFIKVYRSLGRFRRESAFSTWLYRVTINTCKNRIKSSAYRRKKMSVPFHDAGGSAEGNPGLEVANGSDDPARTLEKKQTATLIQKAIEALPVDQRAVVVLRDMEGRSYEEIARITDLNMGTVKSRIARGRFALRAMLEKVLSHDV